MITETVNLITEL